MGKRLASVRADSGRPVTQFAASLDATEADYSAWEAGEIEMPTQLLRALFDRYDVDVSWLISGHGKRYNGTRATDL
jgi:transcriptional regulator with XRE-family HTH domain